MRTDDYEKILDRGWQRSGTWFYRPDIKNSCCPLYTPRLDITEFKLSKQQKKHMRRFNQYINGDREAKNTNFVPVDILSDEEVRKNDNKKQYDNFLKTLDTEKEQLKDLIYDSLIGKGLFIDDTMTNDQRFEIKNEMKVEVIQLENPTNTRCYYRCDIIDCVFTKIEPMLSKDEYIQICNSILMQNKLLGQKFEVYSGGEKLNSIV